MAVAMAVATAPTARNVTEQEGEAMRIRVWAVLAVAACGVGIAEGATLAARLALYDALDVSKIVWGQETDAGDQVGIMDPPYFTGAPDGVVEVLMFPRYTNFAWQRSKPFTATWSESLPDRVLVVRMPKGIGANRTHPYRKHWKVHQRVYFAGELAGVEDQVHEKMAELLGKVGTALGKREQVVGFARTVGISPDVVLRWMDAPEVKARVRMASAADFERMLADEAQGASVSRKSLAPAMIINGRYAVSASAIGDPGEAYRIANRIIRQELEAGRTHDGPTNDAEFTEWMAPREGEMFRRQRFGKKLKFRGVYSHARRELWEIDNGGEVRRAYRLEGEGDRAYFRTTDGGAKVLYAHVWRHARQYVAIEGEGGPQRYGAFLFADWLSAPDTHWVGLPFRGKEVALAFSADGKVEARNDKGPMFGSWWLEGGNLNVSFGELGHQSWPWRKAAARVGFEVPGGSVTPWRSGKARKGSAGGGDAGDGK